MQTDNFNKAVLEAQIKTNKKDAGGPLILCPNQCNGLISIGLGAGRTHGGSLFENATYR